VGREQSPWCIICPFLTHDVMVCLSYLISQGSDIKRKAGLMGRLESSGSRPLIKKHAQRLERENLDSLWLMAIIPTTQLISWNMHGKIRLLSSAIRHMPPTSIKALILLFSPPSNTIYLRSVTIIFMQLEKPSQKTTSS